MVGLGQQLSAHHLAICPNVLFSRLNQCRHGPDALLLIFFVAVHPILWLLPFNLSSKKRLPLDQPLDI